MSKFPALAPKNCAIGTIFPKGWDRCLLGGLDVPGHCRITGGGVKLKHDPKKKAGSDGGRPSFHGLDPQVMDLEIEVWTDDQLEFLYDFCRQVLPKVAGEIKVLVIDHPSLYHLADVVSVQVIGATPLIVDGRKRKLKIQMLHWIAQDTPKGQSVTHTPIKAVPDLRQEAADKSEPKKSPEPSTVPANWAPPDFVRVSD